MIYRGKDQKPILETFQENIDDIESLLSFIYILLSHKKFYRYRKVASSNMSRLEAHAGFFRLLMKGIFDPYVL